MKKTSLTMAVLLLVIALPILAQAQQVFDFNGQALLPTGVGDNVMAYLPVDDAGLIPTPIPLDFANFEYTFVVMAPLAVVNGNSQDYGPGTIVLYEDNATPADYSNPATFSDGTAILSGTFYDFTRTMFTANLGSGSGKVDWTGGTRVGEIAPADQDNWAFVVSISNRSTVTEPGYDENWDGKVEPLEPVVPNTESSMSGFKTRH